MFKKLILVMLLFISFNTYASNVKSTELLNDCVSNRKCELINTLWMMEKGELLVFVPKNIRKKVGDEFLIEYFINLLKEKRQNPMDLIKIDRNFYNADHNAPAYKNPKFLKNLKETNSIKLIEKESEIIFAKKIIE